MHVTVIIAAGGRGQRLGSALPKQLLEIDGRTALQRSIDAFDDHPRVDAIVVATPPEWLEAPARYLREGRKPLTVVGGGDDRQASVANAFDRVASSSDIVLVHDAARPFVSAALIDRVIDAAAESGAAIAAMASRDTVKEARLENGRPFVAGTIPRESIYLAQTPQAFRYVVLWEAVACGRTGHHATDEAALAELAGHEVRLVEGETSNLKITTLGDLTMADALARGSRPERTSRVGTGYDLHRLVEGRPLILGGLTIPFDRGLAGHSDADAVCHAITDAILGAAGAGDIGRHFPDTDPRWLDASSMDLLRRVVALVTARGFAIVNVDVSVIAERPKIAPYADQMRASVAGALGIAVDCVSIKGRTNEGLGEIGRGEAIAVHAVALLDLTPEG